MLWTSLGLTIFLLFNYIIKKYKKQFKIRKIIQNQWWIKFKKIIKNSTKLQCKKTLN
jgi:hypothetical protein